MNTLSQARVSAIIPARNEEGNIARVVRSLAGQEGLIEILVVDDQSTDRTPEILAELAVEIPLLRTRRVDSLPEDWTGKCFAMSSGASAATGDWLLFTDADTEHQAGSLAELLRRAEAENIDLLSLSPGQETPTWWEKSVVPAVYVQLASLFRFADVSDPASPAAAANGQYILVRREIYEKSGGHAAVKSAILDDVELARRIKSQGGKLLFVPGPRWVRTRMYRRFGEMWQGWTKNLYLLFDADSGKMLRAAAVLWLLDLLPALAFVGLCIWAILGYPGRVVTFVAVGLLGLALARRWKYGQDLTAVGFDPVLANYQPLAAGLCVALMISSLRAHYAGRVRWKGREYRVRGKG